MSVSKTLRLVLYYGNSENDTSFIINFYAAKLLKFVDDRGRLRDTSDRLTGKKKEERSQIFWRDVKRDLSKS